MRRKDYGIWKRYSWKEVYEEIKYFSLGLVTLGLQRGDKICMIGENRPELIWAELAAQAVGAAVVCAYPDSAPPELKYIIEDSESRFVVAEDQEQVDKMLLIREETPLLEKAIYWDPKGMWSYDNPSIISFKKVQELGKKYEETHPGTFEQKVDEGKGSDLAVLCYTSGTTGPPKGVMLSHDSVFDNVIRLQSAIHLAPQTQYLSYISPAWAAEQLMGIGMALVVPMVMNFPEGPETVLENIREVAPEFLMFGPRQWESLYSEVEGKMLDANQLQRFVYGRFMALGHEIVRRKMEHVKATWVMKLLRWLGEILIFRPVKDRLGLLKLRVALGGGSSMAPEVFHFFQTLGVDLRQLYGTSEHGFLTTHYDGSFKLESCGQRLKGDPAYGPTLEIDITAQGEIVVRGGPKFLGYYRNPAAMVARFDGDGWFHTGDAGYFDEDGHLIYLDRLEHFRELSTGHRFAPQYVETKLRHSPFIRDVLILGDEKKPYLSALIDIDPEMVGRWAERRGINFNAFTELSQKREVRELIRQEIVKTNRTLPAPSKVIRFVNLPKPFDPDEGDLTRSRKLRRELVEAHNRDIIDKIYSDQDSVSVESIVSYEDGKTGVVRALVKINSLDVEASA